jgi:Fe-S cluster assembly protein SufD
MNNWLGNALNRAETVDDWLQHRRHASLALLRATEWPTRKTEAWKYTSLRPLAEASFMAADRSAPPLESINGLHAIELPLLAGPGAQAPAGLPAGLTVTPLATAHAAVREWAVSTFSSVKPRRHLFGLVNDVLAVDGWIIDVAPGARIEQPLHLQASLGAGQESHQRVLVRLGEGASLTVLEQCGGEGAGFTTLFAEYDIGPQAELEHYRLALQTGAAISIGGSHFQLAERSRLNSTLVGFGSQLSRVDMDILHRGEHAMAKLNAIFLLEGDEKFDLHSTIEHIAANGTTEENVRGLIADRGKAVFNGRIHIHPHAQKTLAELHNRNLLLSPQAEVNTKPELEIYADDVRCAHGATVAEIDKAALYYLVSRGIHPRQANVLLNYGFINELVEQIPHEVIRKWVRHTLRARFQGLQFQ